MKKLLMIVSFGFLFAACGNNSDSKEKSASDSAAAKTEVKDPRVDKGLELVNKSDCFGCHKLTEANIGPAYADIAKKYKTITPENLDSMVIQINSGGAGRWGSVPMTPHPQVSREDAEAMVYYIMSIKP